MIETCRVCLALFNKHWVDEVSSPIIVRERNPGGAGQAKFETSNPCILIKAAENAPLLWALLQRKCADSAFITFDQNGAHLHVVELKSKITLGTWARIIAQFEGMFLTSLAVARLLEIQRPIKVTCYVSGTEDCVSKTQSASPTLLKTAVGEAKTLGGWESWERERISLPLSFEADLKKAWRKPGGVSDFGVV